MFKKRYRLPIGDVHVGASHVPKMTKGVYAVGSPTGRLDYKRGPTPWLTGTVVMGDVQRQSVNNAVVQAINTDFAMLEMKMLRSFFGESMCGNCIQTRLIGDHDPQVDNRKTCQLCDTVWPGLEPDNDRRGAIRAQKERSNGTK